MKRIAFCMRGAVSKSFGAFQRQGDLYNNGDYVDYVACRNSIFRHIIEPNTKDYEFYIFCHCWNTDLENDIVNLYNPLKYKFEDNRIYNDEINLVCHDPVNFSGISQSLSIKNSIQLKEEYERETNTQFDMVISNRYDVLIWKDMLFDKYNNLDDVLYVDNHNCNGTGEFHFVMNNYNSFKFKYLFDSLFARHKYQVHFWIKHYVELFMKKRMIPDNITPGHHIEAMRKIYDSINSGYLTIEQLNSYKL